MKLYCADCMDILKGIPEGSIDMILCDLPYGTTRNKWDVIIPLEPLWAQYRRIIKSNGVIALHSDMPFTAALVSAGKDLYRYELIWVIFHIKNYKIFAGGCTHYCCVVNCTNLHRLMNFYPTNFR